MKGVQTAATSEASEGLRQRATSASGKSAGSSKGSSDAAWAKRSLPQHDRLLVLSERGNSTSAADVDAQAKAAGGTYAARNGQKQLQALGVPHQVGSSDADEEVQLFLAAFDTPTRGQRWWRRPCRRRGKGCCRAVSAVCWKLVPQRFQEKLQPYYAQFFFYLICVRWAARWLWQDRHEMFRELKAAILVDLLAVGARPPFREAKVRDSLRPFQYAVGAWFIYSAWVVGTKVVSSPGPPMDLVL